MITTEKKTVTITMSDSAPLRIVNEDWPRIADASGHDGQVQSQANHEWYIRVREHQDGRRIVYGSYDSGNGGVHIGFRPRKAGYLVPAGADGQDTIRAIRRVAGVIDMPELADECIADLPAQDLV
jgi:hypothetical protein